MNIYLLKANKMYTFKLPLEISGSYILSDYDDNGNKRSLVSVEAISGKWVIKDNDEVKIFYNSMFNNEITLELYNFYQLVVYGTETILMYIAPVYDNSFICTKVFDNTTITCGNSNCDINFPLIGGRHLELNYMNGKFSFKNLNSGVPIYVNNARKEFGYLNSFDMLFIMGLKILILGNKLYINNPSSLVAIFSDKFTDPQFSLVFQDYKANSEFYKDFYEEKDYFYKTPVFRNAFEKLELMIAPPPQKNINRGNPLFLQMVPSALMSVTSLYSGVQAYTNITSGKGTVEDNMMSIVTCVIMLFTSIAWPFIERFYERISGWAVEIRRNKIYNKYLKEKEQLLKDVSNKQKAILIERYLSLAECRDAINNKTPNLFSRGYDNENFLSVRLGIGNVPLYADIQIDRVEYSEIHDKLVDKATELVKEYKFLKETPCYLSLYEKNITAFIGNASIKKYYMDAIILQLLAYHSYADLRIIILTDNAASSSFHYLKSSNYCFSNDKSFRFFSTTFDEGQILSEYLEKIFASRKIEDINKSNQSNIGNRSMFPFYLIISDNISMYKNLKIVKDILDEKNNRGFGILMFDERVNNIPDGCENFVNYDENEGYYFTSEMDSDSIHKYKPEFAGGNYNNINLEDCISKISNIPLKVEVNDSGLLPESLGFLEMYGVGRVEQLNILNRWQNSNIVNSLMTPVGVDANGNLLNLDLHEKKHGPHGLIAGMTGSGKSECIVTYLLSLAVNYSPNEVQFVLIDYKGGGLAGAFENRKTGVKLPHLVGTITNLDQAEMKRTLVSIKSELQRRQRIFNEAKEQLNTGSIDIYKYQRLVRDGKLKEYLSHLFIVCDEFAELKAQQPEFMDELVSAARIGRSLGVHLILATQKPSGVVDEQIWSNSKFKLCCKVQTAEDSNEMIRKPDAAFIKEAGRFYLQVGYDEYFVKGQSAYTGTGYIPSDKIKSKVSTSIDFINNLGDIIKNISKDDGKTDKKVNLGEELINISHYIIDLANKENLKYQQLWLDNVPKMLYLENLRKKYNIEVKPYDIEPLIGEYDDPKSQSQGPVRLALTRLGNTYITGISGSGKTTLLSTLIYSIITTHSAKEVNFYIVDLGAEMLRKFAKAPQVGEVLTINDKQKITRMFYFLQKILEKRKRFYALNGGSFESEVKVGKCSFPNIFVVINGFDVFKEQFEDLLENLLGPFTRECSRYGIFMICTGVATSLGYVVDNNFPAILSLKLADPMDYNVIYSSKDVIPNDNPGRGVFANNDNVYEFQTALVFDYIGYDEKLNYIIGELSKVMKNKAPNVPVVPNRVNISTFKDESISLSSVPIGIEQKSACPYFYDFDKLINIITFGKDVSIKSFLPALVEMFSYMNNIKNIVLSAYDYLTIDNDKVKFYDANFKAVLAALYKNIEKAMEDSNNNNKYIITIFGYGKLAVHFKKLQEESDEEIIDLDKLILLSKNSKKIIFVIVDDYRILRSVDSFEWYNLVDLKTGILISEELDSQELFIANADYSNNIITRDDAIVVNSGRLDYIKYVNKE